VAFNAGNLEPVARAIRAKFPKLHIVICADNDVATPGNPGLTRATEAARAVRGFVVAPDFSGVTA
jgi:putative DNA primase/helicase